MNRRKVGAVSLVGGVGVEGRVEVDQVHRLGWDVVPQDLEVVAVEEGVRHGASEWWVVFWGWAAYLGACLPTTETSACKRHMYLSSVSHPKHSNNPADALRAASSPIMTVWISVGSTP